MASDYLRLREATRRDELALIVVDALAGCSLEVFDDGKDAIDRSDTPTSDGPIVHEPRHSLNVGKGTSAAGQRRSQRSKHSVKNQIFSKIQQVLNKSAKQNNSNVVKISVIFPQPDDFVDVKIL